MTKFQETLRRAINDFWPVFIAAHLHPKTQLMHGLGTIWMFSNFGLFAVTGRPLFLLLAFFGYTPSWISHFVFEKNIPPTLRNPLVAGLCELKMVGLMVADELKPELRRLFGTEAPAPGSPCLVSIEDERAYQESIRYRIRAALPTHPFSDYWKIFLMKHQSPICVGLHAAAMIYLYGLLAYTFTSGRYSLLFAVPLTQLIGLASHALFERNHIDFEDAIFSYRAFLCLNRMLALLLVGRYFVAARAAAQEYLNHEQQAH